MIGYKTSHSKKFRACAPPHYGAFLTWGRRSKGHRSVGHLCVGNKTRFKKNCIIYTSV